MDNKIDLQQAVSAIVETKIRLAVAAELAKSPAHLIEKIVDEAIREPDKSTYQRKSKFEVMCAKMIREAAREALSEWLEQQRPAIKKQVRQRLGRNATKLVTQISETLTAQFKHLRCDLSFRDDR